MGKMKGVHEAVQELLQDYGLYIGQLVVDGVRDNQLDPRRYLEDYMEAHEQPGKLVAEMFLFKFLDSHQVRTWLDTIAWDEDEEEQVMIDLPVWKRDLELILLWCDNEIERASEAVKTLEHEDDILSEQETISRVQDLRGAIVLRLGVH